MVKKVIMNLDLSKVSGSDCIPVVIPKNCENLNFLTYKLIVTYYLIHCWKFSSMVPVFKNVGKKSKARTYCPVSLPSVVNKVFKKKFK